MTPGKTGGYEAEVGSQSPEGASPAVFRERYKIDEVSLLDCDRPRTPRRKGTRPAELRDYFYADYHGKDTLIFGYP